MVPGLWSIGYCFCLSTSQPPHITQTLAFWTRILLTQFFFHFIIHFFLSLRLVFVLHFIMDDVWAVADGGVVAIAWTAGMAYIQHTFHIYILFTPRNRMRSFHSWRKLDRLTWILFFAECCRCALRWEQWAPLQWHKWNSSPRHVVVEINWQTQAGWEVCLLHTLINNRRKKISTVMRMRNHKHTLTVAKIIFWSIYCDCDDAGVRR